MYLPYVPSGRGNWNKVFFFFLKWSQIESCFLAMLSEQAFHNGNFLAFLVQNLAAMQMIKFLNTFKSWSYLDKTKLLQLSILNYIHTSWTSIVWYTYFIYNGSFYRNSLLVENYISLGLRYCSCHGGIRVRTHVTRRVIYRGRVTGAISGSRHQRHRSRLGHEFLVGRFVLFVSMHAWPALEMVLLQHQWFLPIMKAWLGLDLEKLLGKILNDEAVFLSCHS